MAVYVDNKTKERFWSKVNIGLPDQCWEWKASKNRLDGYGQFRIGKKMEYAHRFAFQVHNNTTLLEGVAVLHECDNPSCCNPSHLLAGTQQDNLKDMVSKGRNSCGRGERQGSSKLTIEQVKEVKTSELSNTLLAAKFGVKQHTISNIRTGKTWKL